MGCLDFGYFSKLAVSLIYQFGANPSSSLILQFFLYDISGNKFGLLVVLGSL